jgi:anti-sigma factor RsiW
MTCDQCRTLLWDHLYDLLDAGESEVLRNHLKTCVACQTNLAVVEAQHKQIASAAQLNVVLPPFTAPGPEVETIPMRATVPSSVGRRVRVRPWLAAAAAVFVLAGLPYLLYQQALYERQQAIQQTTAHLNKIVSEREGMEQQAQLEDKMRVQAVRAKHFRIQLVGSPVYHPDGPNLERIVTTDLDGQPIDAEITARIPEWDDAKTIKAEHLANHGDYVVSLPPNLALPKQAHLVVTARHEGNAETVQELVTVLQRTYRTRLVVDRPLYHPEEPVYFRSLTLEQYSLKSPERPFIITYKLTDPKGVQKIVARGRSRKEGIGGDEYWLPKDAPEGEYRLTAEEAENRFPPVTRRFLVRRETSVPLPTEPRVNHVVDAVNVEFFPEGGSLVAGVPNRVYFRVHTPSGDPLEVQGQLVDSHDQRVVAVNTAGLEATQLTRGLGVFTFTPQQGESYKLRISAPANIRTVPVLPAAQEAGLVLTTPTGISGEGERLPVVLHRSGPEQQMVVAVFCRGQCVAEELVTVKPGKTTVQLTPTAGCFGVLRVTVFESHVGPLRPVAERLVYRQGRQRLDLSVKTDQEHYRAGDPVKLLLDSRNETGQAEPAWLLVTVVDQLALNQASHAAEHRLPTYFHLLSDLEKAEDLEGADVLLSDGPQAASALDLFLATQGYRSFRIPDPGTAPPAQAPKGMPVGADTEADSLALLDNQEQATQQAATDAVAVLKEWHTGVAARDQELSRKGHQLLHQEEDAEHERDAFQARVIGYVRLGLGGLVLAALIAGCVFLAIGLTRLLRGRVGNGLYFAGAFAGFSFCLCSILLLGNPLGQANGPEVADSRPSPVRELAMRLEKPLARGVDVDKLAQQADRAKPRPFIPSVVPLRVPSARSQMAALSYRGDGHARWVVHPNPRNIMLPLKGLPPDMPKVVPPLAPRTYAYFHKPDESPATILWQPILLTQNGHVVLRFELPRRTATYRIRVEGHSQSSGRLGTNEVKLVGE